MQTSPKNVSTKHSKSKNSSTQKWQVQTLFPPIHLIHVTVINSFQRKWPETSIAISAEQESKHQICLNLTTKTLKGQLKRFISGRHSIHTPTRTATTISRCTGALVYSGDPAAVISGVIWSLSGKLTVVPVWWLSDDSCWPRDSLSTERNNEPLSCPTLVAF